MIEIFVGFIVLWLFSSEKKERIDPEEYHPYMYDHFKSDGDWDE